MRRTKVEHHVRRRLALVILAACAMILAGCSSPSPGETSPPQSSATVTSIESSATTAPPTTASPSATPAVYKPATEQGPAENVPVPVLPDKAKEFSKEGLIAFTEYWYSTLGYAFETGDPEPMLAISGPDCKTCAAMSKAVVSGHKDGKWIMGGTMDIDPPRTTFNQMSDETFQATTMARQDHVKFFKADGTISTDFGVTIAEKDILIGVYQDNRWTAVTVEHIAGSQKS